MCMPTKEVLILNIHTVRTRLVTFLEVWSGMATQSAFATIKCAFKTGHTEAIGPAKNHAVGFVVGLREVTLGTTEDARTNLDSWERSAGTAANAKMATTMQGESHVMRIMRDAVRVYQRSVSKNDDNVNVRGSIGI